MKRRVPLTAVIQREGRIFVALCPEFDIASQGRTVALARKNLQEAIALFLETASAREIASRLHAETYISPLEMTVDA